jgi:hypothetical protein
VKQLSWCFVLAALPGFGQPPQGSVAPIALYTQFQQPHSQAVEAAVRDELDSIMAPIGLGFEWRSLPQTNPNAVSVELAVVTFKGHCDTANLLPIRPIAGGALGWTHVSDGVILPFSDVDCDRLRGFLQRDLMLMPANERDETFGRAIARVLAHELYHIFANTSKHGSCGIGKSAYTAQELLSDEFLFEERESLALRTTRPHGPPETAGSSN